MKPKVAAVILNWNKAKETLECLDSLSLAATAVVVDNGSQDDSLEIIRKAKPDVPLLALDENRGYAGGNNVGITWALANDCDWVLLVNDDTILAPNSLETLLEAALINPKAGFAGPLILHQRPGDVIQSAGGELDAYWQARHRGQNQKDEGQYRDVEEVPWLSGCVLLARSQMIREVGELDDRFFLYEEELEWCLRARRAGWKVLFVPQARALHAGVSSDYEPKPYVTYYMTRNHFLLLEKARAGLLPWSSAIFETTRTLFSWTFRPKWRDRRQHRDALWRGTLDFLRRRWGSMNP